MVFSSSFFFWRKITGEMSFVILEPREMTLASSVTTKARSHFFCHSGHTNLSCHCSAIFRSKTPGNSPAAALGKRKKVSYYSILTDKTLLFSLLRDVLFVTSSFPLLQALIWITKSRGRALVEITSRRGSTSTDSSSWLLSISISQSQPSTSS